MKYPVEVKYLFLFCFSLALCVSILLLCIHNYLPNLFQQFLISCTNLYSDSSKKEILLASFFCIILTAVVGLFGLKLLFSGYKTNKSLLTITTKSKSKLPKRLQTISQQLGISKNLFVITNHTKPLAITAGLFSPKIILSQGLLKTLSNSELEAVILHERYHQQHYHGLLYILAEAITSAVSFIVPVLRDIVTQMKLDFENAADYYALSYQRSPEHIASALHKLTGEAEQTLFPSFAHNINQRLHILSSRPRQTMIFNKSKLFISFSTLCILSFFAFVPTTNPEIIQAINAGTCSNTHHCSQTCIELQEVLMSTQSQSYPMLTPASVF